MFTDSVDGTLARKFNAKSNIGALLDALGDTFLLVIATAIVLVVFASDNLTSFQTWFYIGLLTFCTLNKLGPNFVSKKYFGKANMLHSYPQKTFGVAGYFGVGYWAFLRDVPLWSVIFLLILSIYATIDEIVYCIRAARYDVNFKGHGFQKYELRKNQ